MRISDWSSDVCSSDLSRRSRRASQACRPESVTARDSRPAGLERSPMGRAIPLWPDPTGAFAWRCPRHPPSTLPTPVPAGSGQASRSEEHTSELQSLMRISYAVCCLKKKQKKYNKQQDDKTKRPKENL